MAELGKTAAEIFDVFVHSENISCTTSTTGNVLPDAGIARYAGFSPPETGILTSPAVRPLVSVVIV
jgi:hypothetical protein